MSSGRARSSDFDSADSYLAWAYRTTVKVPSELATSFNGSRSEVRRSCRPSSRQDPLSSSHRKPAERPRFQGRRAEHRTSSLQAGIACSSWRDKGRSPLS